MFYRRREKHEADVLEAVFYRHINTRKMHWRQLVMHNETQGRYFLEVWTVLYFPLNKAAGSSHGGYTFIYTGDCYTGATQGEEGPGYTDFKKQH